MDLSRAAGRRLRLWLRGSTSIPTDSRAVTPRIGSALSAPKIIVVCINVFGFKNTQLVKPKSK
jgi:hypothetical protein